MPIADHTVWQYDRLKMEVKQYVTSLFTKNGSIYGSQFWNRIVSWHQAELRSNLLHKPGQSQFIIVAHLIY